MAQFGMLLACCSTVERNSAETMTASPSHATTIAHMPQPIREKLRLASFSHAWKS